MKTNLENLSIGVIGLGYVGLPLAAKFGELYNVLGFDVNSNRVDDLRNGVDSTLELSSDELNAAIGLRFSSNPNELIDCNLYIVTVPTPITNMNEPDLSYLLAASKMVGTYLNKGDIVIYESTVYPGATEEDCAPVLEKMSGLLLNEGFFLGYSPERINPGDKTHRLTDIQKVTAGSSPEAANFIDTLYGSIISAGTYSASSIKVAEAAKVIENTQRDVNIALINELSLIFNKLNISTEEVLDAASTKWNFLPFKPGLVGGHCIGVDPYYLTHKAQSVGYEPEIILRGRSLNNSMSFHVIDRLIKKMEEINIPLKGSTVLIMGLTFKENCPDIRNTKVVDMVNNLESSGVKVDIYDPWVDPDIALAEYDLQVIQKPKKNYYDAVIIAVGHSIFLEKGIDFINSLTKPESLIFDLKYLFPATQTNMRL
ncbi:nucleotide sugar dehydrogenase [Gammaproteobacteria bacterium]|nr:nucleotide sugar dehydrogenase [Gammaproteobacteria bacterium]